MFKVNLDEHTRGGILFTLAELLDNHKMTLDCEGNTLTVNTDATDADAEPLLFINELREQEEKRQRSVVDRQFIGMSPYEHCRR